MTERGEAVTARGGSVVVMGVSASGKSAVGSALAQRLGADFLDGDDLHPRANVAKMAAGNPLTDEDRAPWLDRIGDALANRTAHPAGLVVACSALRRAYRDRIRARAGADLRFVFLDVPKDEALRRISGRQGHFMPSSLLDSQYATLESPEGETDVVTLGALTDVEGTVAEAARRLGADTGAAR